MSHVDNVIIHHADSADSIRLGEVNAFFADKERKAGFNDIGECAGGSKWLECTILVGAFNYLDFYGLLEHLKTIKWDYPEYVQVIYELQDEQVMTIWTLTDPIPQ